MKHQYFADERDFLKFDLWMELADHLGQCRLTFVPMFTAPDGTKQGGKRKYAVGERRKCLYDFLQSFCLPENENKRSITELRQFFASKAGRVYHYQPYRDGEKKDCDYFEHERRLDYFTNIPSGWLFNSVVLIDPDTGLETRSRYWRKKPERYATFSDIANVAKKSTGNTVLLVVQFPQYAKKVAAGDLDYRAD